ncbi:cell division protein FtsZ [Methanolapillus millepedarum]|uniref:Tubulin-like protein CetZ n=1 Tax=Methanolapillus millepedarum TaxID=3028296 RepID=A0AA96V468_9EURY|nr:Tubulin-like protein CetZ [Methanosarcinaceae archaeon Ac7]
MLNVLIIGNGQCGNRILDSINKQAMNRGSTAKEASGGLAKYISKHKYHSNVQTVAINTAINDLKEMRYTKAKDRIHIKNLHGVGANRTIGKEVFEQQKGTILRNVEERGNFDVAFVITSASGGTGSSFTPPLIEELKKTHDFPIYAVVVLPFREEGTLYLQNAAFMLKELRDGPCDGIILADNQYLKSIGGNVQDAYDGINSMIARRLIFLLDSLDSEMMMVTDLGDFKTVMKGGAGLATIGYFKADNEMPIRTVIQNALSPRGLLFSTDVYKEAGRAMIILKGDKKYLGMDDVSAEIERLTGAVGHVFKGLIVENGSLPEALCVLTLNSAEELESLYEGAVQAIGIEKDKKDRVKKKKEMESAFMTIDGMDPEY